jgi:hypothetical protein|tara:strand:+ start:2308 stop:3594 length:1287 start_codon:yes stop_codon:yes gene_type:complete
MENNFDLKKFLTENKLTTNSKKLNEKEGEMFDGVYGINIDDDIPSSKTAGISIYDLEDSSLADTYWFGILDGEGNKKIISIEVGGGPINVDDIEKGVVPHEVASDIVDYINNELKLEPFNEVNETQNENEVKEGDIPFYNGSKKQWQFENIADYPVQQAFKKAGVDMSKPVMVTDVDIYGRHQTHLDNIDNTKMDASEAASYYEKERKDQIARALEEYGEEWDDLDVGGWLVMPDYSYDSGGWDETPDGHDFKLVIQWSESTYVIISQKSSGVEKEISEKNKNTVNEQLAAQAVQEFIAADNNGVSIAEFVKAIIDGAAEFNQEDAAYQDLDKRSEVILKAIGRQDLIGGTNETAPGYMHDCAAKVMHEKYGNGDCIPEEHTLVKEGNKYVVTHYDVLFESGKTVKNIPVGELKIITESHHGHKRRKK